MKRISFTFLSITLGFITFFLLTAMLRHGAINSLLAADDPVSYEIMDLGTLGGPESQSVAINNEGQIIGSSTISDGSEPVAFLWEDGIMVPLSVTAGLTTSAAAINDKGLIAGAFMTTVQTATLQFPVLWAGETYTQLETLSDTQGVAQAVNNLGLVAGSSITESNNQLLLWQDEMLSSTIPISGGVASASGLNLGGELVGTIEISANNSFGYLWASGVFTGLGTLDGSSSRALDINDLGQIVGNSHVSGDISAHAFLWEDGEMQDLGTLGDVISRTSQANAINNGGVIAGWSEAENGKRAVLWQEGQIMDLNDMLPVDSEWEALLSAEDINDQGWIVGTGIISDQMHAFLLRPPIPIPPVYFPIIAVPDAPPTPTPTPTPSPTLTPVPSGIIDMNDFLIGDSRLYEVQHSNGSQARHQTQIEGGKFFHTKGNEVLAEWEELWSAGGYIYRGTDTSPGFGRYYTLYADSKPGTPPGSRWSPRYWRVGDIYKRNAYVILRNKNDCSIVPNGTGWAPTWLKLEAYYPQFTFASGLTLQNVIQLAWLQNLNQPPQERYYYAADYGLVGWSSADSGHSHISEIHGSGQRPDNKREFIHCLGQLNQPLSDMSELNDGLLPEKYLRLIK